MSFATAIDGTDALAVETFGELVNYKANGSGAGVNKKGIYDEAYVFIEQLGDGGVQTTAPGILMKGSDIPNVTAHGSTITRGATTFYVNKVEPSNGLTLLKLSKDPT